VTRAALGLALRLSLVVLSACTPSRPAPDVLRVGSSGDYAPFSVRNEVDWGGFDVEVARRFAQDTGRRLELVEFRWPALEIDLAANRFDVAMSGITMRPWRALVGTFARPIARVGAVILAHPGLPATLAELDRPERRIGVNAGGYLERVAHRLFRHAEVMAIPDNRQVAEQLRARTVDAVVSDEIEAGMFRRMVPDAVLLGPVTNDRKAYLARDPVLAEELDGWLRARESDGSLPAFRARMLGAQWGSPHTTLASDLDALLAQIELRLAFMPAVAIAKEARGLPTTDPAQEALVMARARERAALLGVDADQIAALFDAMMRASRRVQDAYRAVPSRERPAIETMDLDTEARPALAGIAAIIVARAAEVAHDPVGLPRPTAALIADALDPSLVPLDDRLAIAQAVVALLRAD